MIRIETDLPLAARWFARDTITFSVPPNARL
jgi:hypothetical protein